MVHQSQFIEDYFNRYEPTNLGPFISVIRGVSYKPADIKEFAEDGVTILRSNNISDGEINYDDLVYVSDSCVSQKQYLRSGDIVMCGSNGSKKLVGKAGLFTGEHGNTSFGAFCLGIRCNDNLSPEYLNAYFNSDMYRSIIEELGNGTNIINIRPDHITSLAIPIPNIEAQKRFVSMSRQADKSKFGGLKSQFITQFGTTEQSSYPVKTLREIALSSGEYGANTPATKYNPEKGRYIRITDIDEFGNLNNDRVSPEVADDKYLLQKGDLLFARTGATVGKTYLHKTGKALYAGYLIKYRLIDTVLPEFVFADTHSKEYYQWVELTQKVGAQPNISAKQYDGLQIVVPPYEKQKAFVALMNQADKSKYLS